MNATRRDMIGLAAAGLATAAIPFPAYTKDNQPMYGLIGQMLATPGKRDELVAILTGGIAGMPGCLSYIVAEDVTNADALWITEVWDNKDSHAASLELPSVRAAITKARPIIAGFPQHFETVPVAGVR